MGQHPGEVTIHSNQVSEGGEAKIIHMCFHLARETKKRKTGRPDTPRPRDKAPGTVEASQPTDAKREGLKNLINTMVESPPQTPKRGKRGQESCPGLRERQGGSQLKGAGLREWKG